MHPFRELRVTLVCWGLSQLSTLTCIISNICKLVHFNFCILNTTSAIAKLVNQLLVWENCCWWCFWYSDKPTYLQEPDLLKTSFNTNAHCFSQIKQFPLALKYFLCIYITVKWQPISDDACAAKPITTTISVFHSVQPVTHQNPNQIHQSRLDRTVGHQSIIQLWHSCYYLRIKRETAQTR